MAKVKPQPISFNRIIGGIADYDKESVVPDSVAFIRKVDYRTNPRRWTILPKTSKESGSVITGLPKWGEIVSDNAYIYDDAGNIYQRTNAGSVTLLRSVSDSNGNGMKYLGEDGYLYYTLDKVIGRYGRIGSTPTFTDDFLGAQGGVPTNTHALDLEASSSRYATAADSASLSITGDLAIEINWKPESLPTVGNEMVLVSKWNENSDERAYKFSVAAISGYFGDGSDGALTISSNTTEAPIDSSCSGSSGAFTLSATNASFAAGQVILIHQSRGTGAGTWQRNKIVSYTAGTITLQDALNATYTDSGSSQAQVRVLKQHTDVTIDSGDTYTAKAWGGNVGGILGFIASGTVTVSGTISANGNAGAVGDPGAGGAGIGFRGGTGEKNSGQSTQGEGTSGAGSAGSTLANGNGGGAGVVTGSSKGASGGGGGHGASGSNGTSNDPNQTPGAGGSSAGSADLTTMVFGGGGGGGNNDGGDTSGGGGGGGGIIFIAGVTLVVTGAITSNGGAGGSSTPAIEQADGAGGAGGSILLKTQTATLGGGLITATGGAGGTDHGGAGAVGRIHLDYLTSFTGTTSPSLNSAQDNNLVTTTTYQLKLMLSSNGTTEESLSRALTAITTGTYGHYAVSWDASDAQAEFFENGVSLGTSTGAFTSLSDTTALLAIGASFDGAGSAEGFLDGIVDDVRVWSAEKTASQIFNNKTTELAGTEVGLVAYYQLDNAATDSTANANDLTLVNTPVYTTDVAFSGATTRLDIDQTDSSTGDTYALGTSVSETAANRQTFVPAKDPQKSIRVNISDKGDDGDWTLVVHDPQNRVMATKTVTNANLNTGSFEFVFDSVWTPIIGVSYHFHVYASSATGTPAVVAGTNNNLETAQFTSYYQFLVEDTLYHPIDNILNFIGIGNGRYLATYDPSTGTYNPHRLTFPSGWKVRCLARWREYYAIGCWKGDAVTDVDAGMIFFWNGIKNTYNFFVEVPEGAINAMLGAQETLYFVAGYQGDLMEYTGGDKARKVKRLPKVTRDKYLEILPGALTQWQTLLQIGAGVTDSSDFEQGVYSLGSRNINYPDSLSLDHIISTGNSQSTGVKIGLVMPMQQKLLIGWKDNVSYGLDVVDPAGDPYSEGSIEWLIRDEGGIWKEKMPMVIRADFEPLAASESIGLQYKLDRASAWSAEIDEDTDDADKLRIQPRDSRHKELQVRLNLKTATTTSPAGLGVTIAEDLLTDEEIV